MKKIISLMALPLIAAAAAISVQAYEIPYENTQLKHFYVFGPDGDKLMGKEDSKQEIFFEVPSNVSEFWIRVNDPDTGDFTDWRTDVNTNPWNTQTKFSVFGQSLLDSKTFGEDKMYDQASYQFGPYSASKGEDLGNGKKGFRLLAEGISGDDQNLFSVEVGPNNVESYATDITFRLLHSEGQQMFFYPEIKAGASTLTIENYDLDETGGYSSLLEGPTMIRHDVKGSTSGRWMATTVQLQTSGPGRLNYVITKATQRHANAGLKIKDDNGNPVRIYFRKGAPTTAPAVKPAPVVAKAPVSNKCNTFTFDARDSFDDDNQKLEYLWDFGDGTTSTTALTTHTYEKAGDYNVTLKVTDNSGLVCNTAVTSDKVTANTPPAAKLEGPDSVCTDQAVTLSASGTTDNTPEKLTYEWDLGDGTTQTGVAASKTFTKGGLYRIQLQVNDNAGTACSTDSAEKTIKVNTKPVADAGKDIAVCIPPSSSAFAVRLDASGTVDADRDNLSYAWDFGDGTSGEGKSPTHEYAKPGNYRASVVVDDNSGLSCSSSVDLVNIVLNKAPIADAGKDLSICTDSVANFDASGSSDDEALKYSWDFGDGSVGTGAKTKHTYEKAGQYTAVLSVDDGRGMPCSIAQNKVTVKVNSGPVIKVEDAKASCVGDTVAFTADASDADGDSLKLTWDFGDGTVQTGGTSVSHKYTKGGFYPVTVTADDGRGMPCSVATDTAYVDINTRPVANAGENLTCCVDKSVNFDASKSTDADGDTLSYSWDFGDGSTASSVKADHAYKKNGKYNVLLTVNDNENTKCSESTDGFVAEVNAKPVPIIKIN